jgi:hypothetical protein
LKSILLKDKYELLCCMAIVARSLILGVFCIGQLIMIDWGYTNYWIVPGMLALFTLAVMYFHTCRYMVR